MAVRDKELFEFGSFRLDPAEHLLLRDGQLVPLEPKVFETLLVLIRHRGRLVGKDELMQTVWPDSFVEESNLTRNILVLRKALNRNEGGSQYIERVPKLAYRFVGDVRGLVNEQTELIVRMDASSRRPVEKAFAVQHFHGRLSFNHRGWSAAAGRIAIPLVERNGARARVPGSHRQVTAGILM